MKKPGLQEIKDQRIAVSKLIIAVLSGKLLVRDALLAFPKNASDETIIAVWHALCHFEADEDMRDRDGDYANEQDDYLGMLYEILSLGEELPQNIIDSYEKFYADAPIPLEQGFKGLLAQFRRFINL